MTALTVRVQSGAIVPATLTPNGVADIGDACTHCGCDTVPGSGAWVNRVPSGADSYDADGNPTEPETSGYICADCQAVECDRCGELTIEYSAAPSGNGFWCDDCRESNAPRATVADVLAQHGVPHSVTPTGLRVEGGAA